MRDEVGRISLREHRPRTASVVFGEGKIPVKRRLSIWASSLLVGATTAVLVGGAPAGAQVSSRDADYKGYATGSVVHVDALRGLPPSATLLNTEVAFSGASVASKGLGQIVNEVDQVVSPGAADKRSFGRGSGLEIGVANAIPNADNDVILAQKAQATAPPNSGPVSNQVGPVKVNPLAYASLLRGQAEARWNEGSCVVGEPISFGQGYAADVQLVNTGADAAEGFGAPVLATDAPSPERRISQSQSTTRLIPQVVNGQATGAFGLQTETRMTIAPITLFKNQAAGLGQLTIEFLGEWVLRATADGRNPAKVHYGPGAVSPQTPVLRIIQGTAVTNVLTLQQVTDLVAPGGQGIVVNVPGVVDLAIGEDPRAIGNPPNAASAPTQAADGTEASGAVDVVRVRLLDDGAALGLNVADLRIGHMEVQARVPAGGIRCELPVSKVSDKQDVNAGEQFTYTINVLNPFADCELTNVRVEDNITTAPGIRYTVTGTTPQASAITPAANQARQVVFNDIGPIPAKQSKAVTITVQVLAGSGGGLFTNNARATGQCATGGAEGGARINVPISGETTVTVPRVTAVLAGALLPATGVEPDVLPRTGGEGTMALLGLGLLGAAAGLRRIRRTALR